VPVAEQDDVVEQLTPAAAQAAPDRTAKLVRDVAWLLRRDYCMG
jgi:hypothetical protein